VNKGKKRKGRGFIPGPRTYLEAAHTAGWQARHVPLRHPISDELAAGDLHTTVRRGVPPGLPPYPRATHRST
jgi:hypothetical protein